MVHYGNNSDICTKTDKKGSDWISERIQCQEENYYKIQRNSKIKKYKQKSNPVIKTTCRQDDEQGKETKNGTNEEKCWFVPKMAALR